MAGTSATHGGYQRNEEILTTPQLPPQKHVKIAYLGKILRENDTLIAQGWREGHMLNGLVFG